jgi:hypothetical protein
MIILLTCSWNPFVTPKSIQNAKVQREIVETLCIADCSMAYILPILQISVP